MGTWRAALQLALMLASYDCALIRMNGAELKASCAGHGDQATCKYITPDSVHSLNGQPEVTKVVAFLHNVPTSCGGVDFGVPCMTTRIPFFHCDWTAPDGTEVSTEGNAAVPSLLSNL